MNALYSLIYSSKNRIDGTADEVAASIKSILAAAQRNNPNLSITGALMFNRGCFVQVLEGPRMSLSRTFERIQQDERHGEVSILAFEPVEGRRFENWSMAFVGMSVDDEERHSQISRDSGFDPRKISADRLADRMREILIERESLPV